MKRPVSRTVPATPCASMYWPTRNGRSSTSMMPAAMFCSVPCSASTMVSTRTIHCSALASSGRMVSSTCVPLSARRAPRATRADSHQPAIRIRMAARQFIPWLMANWTR
ncbi:hypothetical protein D3C72_1913430 [compost metagenome]